MSQSQASSSVPSLLQSVEQLEANRLRSEEFFRTERMSESRKTYLDHFQEALTLIESLLAQSDDLQKLNRSDSGFALTPQLLEALRFVTGPPISIDDLKTVVGSSSLSPSALATDEALGSRIVEVLNAGLDTRRFPWVEEGRHPNEEERYAAILASASLMATRRTETGRRSTSKRLQEERVYGMLIRAGLEPITIPRNAIATLNAGPGNRQFCAEAKLGSRKADFVVGLGDGRTMAIECKVSNSSINSVKRLNNDAAVKAVAWIRDFGTVQIVPVAVLSGVYKLHNLIDAQARGLYLAWDHDLESLGAWILSTYQ
jgi:hypothetical protein